MCHEGGYSEVYVPFCGVRVLEALLGGESGVVDPFEEDVGSPRWTKVCHPHQAAEIETAEKVLKIALLP